MSGLEREFRADLCRPPLQSCHSDDRCFQCDLGRITKSLKNLNFCQCQVVLDIFDHGGEWVYVTSVVMPGRQSLRLVPARHHHFRQIDGLVVWSVARAQQRPCQVHGSRLACGIVLTPVASSAVVPLTPSLALRANGRASNTTALRLIDVPGHQPVGKALVRPAKALGVASLRIVRKPRSQQRGHVTLQVAALGCSATSPLSRVLRPPEFDTK